MPALFSLNRYQAFGMHFLCSIILIAVSAILIFFVFYPGLIAYASGVTEIFMLLVFVDAVLGPLITLIIFDTKKKELKRDLLTVVVIQLIALFYGLWIMFSARPVFVVFNTNQFDVVYANEISASSLARVQDKNFSSLPLLGPVYLGARLPSDPNEAQKIIMNAIAGGDDVQHMPEYYISYQEISADIINHAKPLSDLQIFNEKNTDKVKELINHYLSVSDKVGYVPLRARVRDLTLIIDKETANIIEMNKLQPFDYSFGANSINLKKTSDEK